jgi:hypothetical protein
MTTIA